MLNKAAIIERSLKRIDEEYQNSPAHLHEDLTRQDSIILNLERCCEAAIDIAMRWVSRDRLGIPQESREAFELIVKAGKINPQLGKNLQAMVGFRNIAVHDYQA